MFCWFGEGVDSTVFQLIEYLVCPLLMPHTMAFSNASNNIGQLYVYFRLFLSEPSILFILCQGKMIKRF